MKPRTAFYHIPEHVIKQRCIHLHQLDPSERCEFVNKSLCDDNSNFFKYHYIMFCDISNPSFDDLYMILYILGMVILMFFLFIILAVTVDNYFCPALGQLSRLMRLSENLSGVTLLALGNGAADILSSIMSGVKGDTILMYNQILGGAMFVSCVVVGCIVIARPFYVQPYYFLRDTIFLLSAGIWIESATKDEKVSTAESCVFITIYVLYLAVVIIGVSIQEHLEKYVKIEEEEVDWAEMRKRRQSSLDLNVDGLQQFKEKFQEDYDDEYDDEPATIKKLFKDFFISLNPINVQDWTSMGCFNRFLEIIKAPFVLVLNFIIPVYSPGEKRRGWSKLLNCFQSAIYLPFMLYGIGTEFWFGHKVEFYPILLLPVYNVDIAHYPLVFYVAPFGILMAMIMFCTARQTTPPRYYCIFAFMAFTMGIVVIFTTVKEIVAVLSLFGTILRITPQTLGLTILAWGNSLGDAVANVKIAKQGFQRMALAASFAGVLANSMLSMGITFLIKNLQEPVMNKARGGVMGPNCATFLIINLVFSIFYVLFTKFQARRSYGIFLILIYIEFLLFCVLSELEFIHPLGTDHEFAKDLFNVTNI